MKTDLEETAKSSVPKVDTVARALDILECFTSSEPELSLKQLSDKTGLYKSRVHRLCGTLIDAGFLIRTSWSSYRLGPKLMILGKVYEKTNTLVSVARPIMRDIASATGESVALFTLEGDRCLCMAREFGTSRLVFAINEGDYMQLHASASGRILLAYASEEFRQKVLGSTLEKFTSATMVDKAQLEDEFNAIRRRGYAVNREERERGVAAIAAPVFDHENKVRAVLAVVGPDQRYSEEHCADILNKLLPATREISRLLGESR